MKKRMRTVNKVLSLALLSSLLLVGCNEEKDPLEAYSKKELIGQYHNLENMYDSLSTEYADYKSLTMGIQSENEITAAISITGDGTGRFTFNSYDSKIIFPTTFQYPNSTTIAGDGKVNIVNNVTVTPTSNWVCKLNGSTLELENPDSGISGTIKVGSQSYLLSAEELKNDVISAWFEGLPPSKVTYTNINIAKQASGIQATTATTIDSEDAFLRCGMAGCDKYCLTYIFTYRGQRDTTKDESITNLLNTMEVLGKEVLVEQS